MEAQTILGGCLRGSVRYEAIGAPYHLTRCHCADCRRSSDAPFVTWASFRRDDFRFISGAPATLTWDERLRLFCARCGTPLVFRMSLDAEELDVTVCSFDHPEAYPPGDHTWVEDQLPWMHLADGLPAYEQKRKKGG